MSERPTRISKTRRARAKRLTERYADCHGIPFDSYRLWLPEKVSDWPAVVRVDDSKVCELMHERFDECWICDEFRGFVLCEGLEAHHIIGGTKGRADEFTNIAILCRKCHTYANSDVLPMGRILYLKWKHDRQHTDWVRLALLHRRFLPSLLTDKGEFDG